MLCSYPLAGGTSSEGGGERERRGREGEREREGRGRENGEREREGRGRERVGKSEEEREGGGRERGREEEREGGGREEKGGDKRKWREWRIRRAKKEWQNSAPEVAAHTNIPDASIVVEKGVGLSDLLDVLQIPHI